MDLSEYRSSVAGCDYLIFGDIQAGIVLRADGTDFYGQEDFDRLLQRATDLMKIKGPPPVEEDTEDILEFITIKEGKLEIFALCPSAPSDVVCAGVADHQQLLSVQEMLRAVIQDHVQ